MSDEPWRPHPGAMVQIWDYIDHPDDEFGNRLHGHGSVGYVVKRSGGTDNYHPEAPGPIFKVIVFNKGGEPTTHDVWHGWLRQIKKSSDIKKVVDTE